MRRSICFALLTAIFPLTLGFAATPAYAQDASGAEAVPAAEGAAPGEPASEPAAEPAAGPAAEPATEKAAHAPAAEAPLAEPPAEDPGQADLDRATELKLGAEGLRDLNRVIDLLDDAIRKGLSEGNREFAESMLVATIMQRAEALARAVLRNTPTGPQVDPRWGQLRRLALTDLGRVTELDDTLVDAHLLIGQLELLRSGDRAAALEALGKVVEAEGAEPEQRAQAYVLRAGAEGDPQQQLADLSQAIELQPKNANFYVLRSRAAIAAKDFETGLADLGKAIDLEPTRVEYRLLRATAHQQNDDLDAALGDVAKAEAMAPDNAGVFELKGILLTAQGKTDEALAAFDRAAEISPDSVATYRRRAELFLENGETEQAIGEFTKAIDKAPDNLALWLTRAQLYSSLQRFEEALSDVEAALGRAPGLLRAHLMRTALLSELGRGEEALAMLNRLSSVAPDDPAVLMQISGVYAQMGEAQRAIDSLTRVVELTEDLSDEPSDDESSDDGVGAPSPLEPALQLRGDTYLSIGKHEEAIADFARLYELNPDNSGMLNNYAWTLATSPIDSLRDGALAIKLAARAAELTDYAAAHILSTLAAAHAEAGDFDKAIEWSEKAVQVHAEDQAKTRDMTDALAAELESYRRGEPWRELQQDGQLGPSVPAKPAEEEPADAAPPPVRTLDF
ncbi:MAG: tetratricopeptide repeat protein [Planctomycetota bacterium]